MEGDGGVDDGVDCSGCDQLDGFVQVLRSRELILAQDSRVLLRNLILRESDSKAVTRLQQAFKPNYLFQLP